MASVIDETFDRGESFRFFQGAESLDMRSVCSRTDFASQYSVFTIGFDESFAGFEFILSIVVQGENEPTHSTVRHVVTRLIAQRVLTPPRAAGGGWGGDSCGDKAERPLPIPEQGDIYVLRAQRARGERTKLRYSITRNFVATS